MKKKEVQAIRNIGEPEQIVRKALVKRAIRTGGLVSLTLAELKSRHRHGAIIHCDPEIQDLHFCTIDESILRMIPAEIPASYGPPVPDELQIKDLMHLAIFAASFLGHCIAAASKGANTELPGALDAQDLDLITIVLEKQPLNANVASSDLSVWMEFRYRIVIFARYDRPIQKGSSVDSGLARDTEELPAARTGKAAPPIVKGPYAPSIDLAIQAFYEDVDSKVHAVCRKPGLVSGGLVKGDFVKRGLQKRGLWVIRPSRKAIHDSPGDERIVPEDVWFGLNVWPIRIPQEKRPKEKHLSSARRAALHRTKVDRRFDADDSDDSLEDVSFDSVFEC